MEILPWATLINCLHSLLPWNLEEEEFLILVKSPELISESDELLLRL